VAGFDGLREIKIKEKTYVTVNPLLAKLSYRKEIDGRNKVIVIMKDANITK
jgi:hypothetical protein